MFIYDFDLFTIKVILFKILRKIEEGFMPSFNQAVFGWSGFRATKMRTLLLPMVSHVSLTRYVVELVNIVVLLKIGVDGKQAIIITVADIPCFPHGVLPSSLLEGSVPAVCDMTGIYIGTERRVSLAFMVPVLEGIPVACYRCEGIFMPWIGVYHGEMDVIQWTW